MLTRIAFVSLLAGVLAAPSQRVARDAPKYVSYAGDGSVAAGWPAKEQWASFDEIWNTYEKTMLASCSNYAVKDTSPDELKIMKEALHKVAKENKVDDRVLLVKVIQESLGCVRVWGTESPGDKIYNPGLMQNFEGKATCNNAIGEGGKLKTPATKVLDPCPQDQIEGMIREGTIGTNPDPKAEGNDLIRTQKAAGGPDDAQNTYRAARLYNSGLFSLPEGPNQDITKGGATPSYPADIANRLMGVFFTTAQWKAGEAPKGPASGVPTKATDKPTSVGTAPVSTKAVNPTAATPTVKPTGGAANGNTKVVQATSTARVTSTAVVASGVPASGIASGPAAPTATGVAPSIPSTPATGGTCAKDGEITCSPDGKQFGFCSGGKATVFQPVAPGTTCSMGEIIALDA